MEKTQETIENKYEKFLELLKTNPESIESQVVKNEYKNILEIFFEKAKLDSRGYEYKWPEVVSNLLKLNILKKSEIKEQYRELLEIAFEKAKFNWNWGKVVSNLLKLNILEKSEIKEQYRELLEIAFEEAKSDTGWVEAVSNLLQLNILSKSEIEEQYRELLKISFEKAKTKQLNLGDVYWAIAVSELLKSDILEKNERKQRYKESLQFAFEKAKQGKRYWDRNVVPALLKLNILEKSDKERYKELLKTSFEKAKTYDDWSMFLLPELLKLNMLEKSDKERYRELLKTALKKAETDYNWSVFVLPELLKLNILEKSEIKEQYKNLLERAFEKAKINSEWAETVSNLLRSNILEKDEIKEKYKELLETLFEKANSGNVWNEWVGTLPNLLKANILEKSDKEQYKNLLERVFNKPRLYRDVLPELLKLKIFDESDKNFDISLPQNITLAGTTFLEKNKDKIGGQDIEFIDQIDDYFSKAEIDYLYKQDYEYFKEVEIAVKNKDYQKIWGLKKEFYSGEEKEKIEELEKHFGKGVWTYFVDKVPGDKKLKNRFRDPHNALLYDITVFYYKYLDKNGVTKEDFLKNYLGVAGDRNNGYQQLNNFIEKGKYNWKELVQGSMNIDEFKENREFMNLAEGVLEQEKTGELYKNLDNLEQILTLLHMIRNKKSLIKLGKLANSNNPDDKKLYEYYKGAIYHPRTKPIIMKMYEDPGEFLGLDDTTFDDLSEIHQAKKPSNMVENFEYLDFDARDLVNCLPLGVYDRLSYFKPFEMKFFISGSEVFTKEEIQQKVSEFLLGADQKKISVIITKLKEQGDETMWFKEWKANKDEFVKKLLGKYGEKDFINMFVNLGYSEFNKYKDLREMTAKISPKSDPNNWFNGFNCDSLAEGHGKKVVAMFNPYCTDFCIYEGDQDPKEDNLKVTSWVTLNRAISENFTKLLDKVKSETTHDIVSVLGDKFEDYRDPSEYVITMDNIEANPNFGSKNELTVRKMYEKFFSEYVRQNPISPNGIPINTSKFYSGVNYNKLDILTDKVPNESLPVFVNAYSDNSASYSLKGNLDAGEQKEKQKKTGIHPLSIEDVVQISYMEGKIYPSSMKDHLGNLQHEITASILNNTLKNRPNLSFAWYNEEGKIGGYILAYQGKMEDGTPGVYISDFAIDEKERGTAGIKMIYHRMQEMKKNYPDMPIFTRARENTSYRMVKAFAGRQGYEIVEDELMQDGGENFHRVVMNPKK